MATYKYGSGAVTAAKRVVVKDAFVQKPDIAHLKPRFEDWRLIKAQALVTGKLLIKDEKLKVELNNVELKLS